MAIDIPMPWLRTTSPIESLSSGASAGAAAGRLEQESVNESARLGMEAKRMAQSAALQQAQLDQAAQQHAMEFQARQKLAEQNQLRQQQQLNIENAYKTAQIGVAQGRLQQAQKIADDKARAAALTFQREQTFAKDVASGIPVMEAYQRNPVSSAVLRAAQGTLSSNKPMHVGESIVERDPTTGEWTEKYKAPRSAKPIKIGKQLVRVNDDGTVNVLYRGDTSGPDILGAASEPSAPTPGLFSRIKNVFSPSPPEQTKTNKDKIVRAHALGIAHPDWTKEQIIDAVNKEMQ